MQKVKRIFIKIWEADEKIWLLLSLLFFSVFLLFFQYTSSLNRCILSLKDFGTSVAHWFVFCFDSLLESFLGYVPQVEASFMTFPESDLQEIFGIDLELIRAKFSAFGAGLFTMFGDYNYWLLTKLYNFSFISLMLFPSLIIFYYVFKSSMLSDKGNDIGYVTRPARALEFVIKRIALPTIRAVSRFVDFMLEHRIIFGTLIFIWLLSFNALTVIVEAFAFYFYFISSFDLLALLMILGRILLDSVIMLLCMPLVYWTVIGIRIVFYVLEVKAVDKLLHMESMNCGYLKTLDIVTLIIGEPGKGKTTLLTDMVLSWVNIYKTETLKTMYKLSMYFPAFPFSKFRAELEEKIQTREIFCLPQVNDWVDTLFVDGLPPYGYDLEVHKAAVDVGNREISLSEALKTYGRAFTIYYNNNPSLSNYPIRFDGNFDDSKYLKLWDGNFFKRKKESRYSRILVQDMLRHGVKMNPNSPYNGAFGYGVYSHTELAKSVGNQNTNADYKTKDKTCNPRNDKHSYSFMMGRHPFSTVDNFVYFRYIGDEQRASSLCAEELGLMSVVSIGEKGDLQVAINGFAWLFILKKYLDDKFKPFHENFENARGDITLSIMALKYAVSAVNIFTDQLEGKYGYRETELIRQQGSAFSGNAGTTATAGAAQSHIYYQMNMKDYSDRFMTDCYSQLYAAAQKACGMGIMDMQEYGGLGMTPDEMELQGDHFMKRLIKMLHGEGDFEENKT